MTGDHDSINNFFLQATEELFYVLVGVIVICTVVVTIRIIGQFLFGW